MPSSRKATGRGFVKALAIGIASTLAATVMVAVSPMVTPAQAADNSSFDPGFIISDETFFNKLAMSADGVRSFIGANDGECVSGVDVYGTMRTCLLDFSMKTTSRVANENCAAYSGATESAASIIYRVGQACGINPQVILVTLQKEQGFITGGPRSSLIYRKAMGMGCPDTNVCDSKYYGFYNQVYQAAWQLRQYGHSPNFQYKAGKTLNIGYNPSTSCGSSPVYIRNEATAALYNYTPYQPNSAALAAGGGVGDSCSAYGNRNFWRYFTDWFGNPANLLPGGSFDTASLTGWVGLGGNSNIAHKRPDTRAQSGTGFMAASTAEAGRSVAKTVSRSVEQGQSYTSTIWVRSGSETETYAGRLALRTTGGTAEAAVANFVVGPQWTPVTVGLDILNTGHTGLTGQVHEDTPVTTLFVDSASIAKVKPAASRSSVRVSASSFESASTAGWVQNSGGTVAFSSLKEPLARPAVHGSYYLNLKTAAAPASVAQTIARKSEAGESFTLRAWVRSRTGNPVSGKVAIATTGGIAESEYTSFVAGPEWQNVSVTITNSRSSHTGVKAGLFLSTSNLSLEVDRVSIVPNLAVNPSFESASTTGWFQSSVGTYSLTVASATADRPAKQGTKFAQLTRTGTASSRLGTDVKRNARAGQTYTFGVWLRSSSPDLPYSTQLRITGRGSAGAPVELASKSVTVNSEWSYHTVSIKLAADQPVVRAEIQASSMTFPLDIDGALIR